MCALLSLSWGQQLFDRTRPTIAHMKLTSVVPNLNVVANINYYAAMTRNGIYNMS